MKDQIAKLSYLRIAPRKVRAVASLLKGLSVNEAEAQLLVQRRRPAKPLLKLLRSAISNAKNNSNLDVSSLFVKIARVDQGPMIKRSMPRARGSSSEIQKKMSHVTLILGENSNFKPARFKIIIKKKSKLPKEKSSKKSSREKTKENLENRETISPKKPNSGVLKKMFSRKSGMGK